jgi:protocatechuate 3,4-dioxygenase beta subunit
MLAAAGRSPMRAAHLHFMVSAEGQRTAAIRSTGRTANRSSLRLVDGRSARSDKDIL